MKLSGRFTHFGTWGEDETSSWLVWCPRFECTCWTLVLYVQKSWSSRPSLIYVDYFALIRAFTVMFMFTRAPGGGCARRCEGLSCTELQQPVAPHYAWLPLTKLITYLAYPCLSLLHLLHLVHLVLIISGMFWFQSSRLGSTMAPGCLSALVQCLSLPCPGVNCWVLGVVRGTVAHETTSSLAGVGGK